MNIILCSSLIVNILLCKAKKWTPHYGIDDSESQLSFAGKGKLSPENSSCTAHKVLENIIILSTRASSVSVSFLVDNACTTCTTCFDRLTLCMSIESVPSTSNECEKEHMSKLSVCLY